MEGPQYSKVRVDEESGNEVREESRGICGLITTFLFTLLTLPLFFFPLWASFFIVNPQEEVLILFWGKLNKVCKTTGTKIYNSINIEGIHWYNRFGRTLMVMSTRTQNIEIKKTTVVDLNGNPIIVSAVVTYRIVDSVKAAFGVQNVHTFLSTQALATLKKVCSRYPYESKDGHSLQRESDAVSKEMIAALQSKADLCGVRISSYELCDLQYAPEIAQGMLVRQQAQALLDARKTIVDGAIGIVSHAVSRLMETGVKLNDKEQNRLVSNLLTVICSDARVQPTFSISENVDGNM